MRLPLTAEELLHPRIVKNCLTLYADGHYKHAAQEAMTQVEQAIKEKTGLGHQYGVNLVKHIFGQGSGVSCVSHSDLTCREKPKRYSMPRLVLSNYATHEGDRIDEMCAFRVMVLATELLNSSVHPHSAMRTSGAHAALYQRVSFHRRTA